jgi:DNA-binding MurR/RpiR family transcriptional regulator
MHVNRLSLLNSLLSVINENEEDDAYAVLAHYFLDHYSELDQLNIYDVAADCFISRSSIRRFCQSIGCDNFRTLKNEYGEYDDKKENRLNYMNKTSFRSCLTDDINGIIAELNNRMNTKEVDIIVDRIHNAHRVVLLAADTSASAIKDFQQNLVFCGKIIRIISETFTDNTLLVKMTRDDYLMTFSMSGVFANAAKELVKNCHAYKTLVTVSRRPEFTEFYDKVYHLSALDRSSMADIFGKYGVNYMLDVIASTYLRKYGSV